ncbi:SDR family NAD(P)-dependent oxidoreductase [Stakelama tenebrarum]|uniref:SDR family oxidoreductase n=1 Tax=Stakelama tenebrarum TaxID=2711215 RepID=A0A6G6Y7E5_9SPHN|nr:SDR family oxidoreductase [Sphingosinithalassobacter tenebrarum]QIG80771.1 SDR family oxidoreductase [Sphingosinithalassobacter tenebrarum]
MVQDLAGKVAIVTGGAGGIGLASCEMFVAQGAKVVIADVSDDAGNALADRLGDAAVYAHADVSQVDDIQALVDLAVERFGGLDIMFNNAGISGARVPHFLDDDLSTFRQVIDVNLFGVMAGSQRAARYMKDHGGGVILNNASIAGLMAGVALMSYRASKAAVIHLTKSLAIDLAQYGIRVNCLVPGHIRSPIHKMYESAVEQETAERIEQVMKPVWDSNKPLKRDGVPKDVAEAAVFLASDRAAQITGATLAIDGGISAGDPVNHLEELLAAQARAMAGETA